MGVIPKTIIIGIRISAIIAFEPDSVPSMETSRVDVMHMAIKLPVSLIWLCFSYYQMHNVMSDFRPGQDFSQTGAKNDDNP